MSTVEKKKKDLPSEETQVCSKNKRIKQNKAKKVDQSVRHQICCLQKQSVTE